MIEIIQTKDGSHTLKNTELNETYHSIHGAVQESVHVFIKNGFGYKYQSFITLSILEVGFGTGLNAWLTMKRANETGSKILYTTLESYPLEESIWSKLNYAQTETDTELFRLIHQAAWGTQVELNSNATLQKLNTTIQQAQLTPSSFDLIYYDAFAPEKQPDMWSVSVFEKVASAMKSGATLVTYCAKGQVKRDLKSVGLTVESLPGPPGKREMIRASKRIV